MAKKEGSGIGNSLPEESSSGKGVVDLADARVRLRSRSRQPSNRNLLEELDEVRSLLDQGLSAEAKSRIALLISAAQNNPSILALARCALSTALEMQGQNRELNSISKPSSLLRFRLASPITITVIIPKRFPFLKVSCESFLKAMRSQITVRYTLPWPASIAASPNTQLLATTLNEPWNFSAKQESGVALPRLILELLLPICRKETTKQVSKTYNKLLN